MDTLRLGTDEHPLFTIFEVKKEQCVNFLDLFHYVHKHGRHTVNRKGQGLYEMRNVTLVLEPEASPYCFGRYPSTFPVFAIKREIRAAKSPFCVRFLA